MNNNELIIKKQSSPLRISEHHCSDNTVPFISISCITYNHENFIRKAIEGFLAQKTRFPVEILIHDDESTDSTRSIIKEYANSYPYLIKTIFQNENQYSKGKQVHKFNLTKARGSFIALCHGDDYWLDEYKLEKQVEAMVAYDVGISGHSSIVVDNDGMKLDRISGTKVDRITWFSAYSLLRKQGNMLPYSSIMIDWNARNEILKNMPPVKFHTGIQILASKRNGLVILPGSKSVYRSGVVGSTTEILLSNSDKRYITTIERIDSIKFLKDMYPLRYNTAFNKYLAIQFFKSKSKNLFKRYRLYKQIITGQDLKSKSSVLLYIIVKGINHGIKKVFGIKKIIKGLRKKFTLNKNIVC